MNRWLTSWKVPASEHTAQQPVTLRGLLSHTSGTDDGSGFPGYAPGAPVPTPVQILNGAAPSNVKAVVVARRPLTAFKYSGGGLTLVQLLLTDALKRPFPDLLRETVLGPIGMNDSAYEEPLSGERDRHAARLTIATVRRAMRSGTSIPSWPRRGCGPPRPIWRDSASSSEITARPLEQGAIARRRHGNGDAGRCRPVCNRHGGREERRRLVPAAGGSNWGFQCLLIVHKLKGYGVAIMTNSDAGGRLIAELQQRVAAAYKWDSLDQPLRR